MEEERPELEEQETPSYVKRPWWQVWLARLALVVFIIVLVLYYAHFFRGGA